MTMGSPSAADLAVLLGLSFFLGLAFEDVFAHAGARRPGGIRTFPMLAIVGAMLYAVDPQRVIPFAAGLVMVGAWLHVYYREHIHERDETGQPNVGLMVGRDDSGCSASLRRPRAAARAGAAGRDEGDRHRGAVLGAYGAGAAAAP
jgi:hypothetical protein